ncbi:MAG TPA: excisionase family DNA-binding protein [Candidatus Angelobacter sp.]|nr:excisionase family DNA-binding protein [Candidatus Angelobacter sp.]
MKSVQENSPDIAERDRKDVEEIYRKIKRAEAKLIGPDGRTHLLPENTYAFLCRLLAELTAGKSVTLLQSNAELTSMEASKLLGMSRQYLVQLLEKGEIPFHKVGTHRRLYTRDVLAYKAKRDMARRKAHDDLVLAEYEEGIYDKITPDDSLKRE